MTVEIENSDVLQACVTALIGVLIFLTLERKFEKKDLTMFRIDLVQEKSRLLRKIEALSNEIKDTDKSLNIKSINAYNEYQLQTTRKALDKSREGFEQDLVAIEERIRKVDSDGKIDDDIAAHYKKIKDREDIVSSIAVALLSISVIFMIFIPTGWKIDDYYLNYFTVSRFFFAAGISALVCRVFLYTLDVKSNKSKEQ